MNRFILFAAILLTTGHAFSQTAPPADLVTIQQSLNKLNVLGSVLYVAAHPDDENTRLLAYLAQEKHYRTGYLSLTRGDGGQNLIGNEQGEVLGLIRTQELLAARRVDGAEQFFSRANDFGFSKGPGETLKIWDHEKVLGDAVWVIRKFRPDVIICRFPTTGEGGHGHHTSSAIIAQEAFAAAADPKRFPEQLKYVQTWQAKRLLWNTFSFGTVNTTANNQFKIDVGVYNPILGKGYGEMAADSRSNHKTQGFGTPKVRGAGLEYFKTILGDAPKDSLLSGVNTTWTRVAGGESIAEQINFIKKNFDSQNPQNSVPALIDVLNRVAAIKDTYWRDQKSKELRDLITGCAGLWFESYAMEPVYAVGDSIGIVSQIYTPYKLAIPGFEIRSTPKYSNIYEDRLGSAFKPGVLLRDTLTGAGKIAAKLSQPYWLAAPHNLGTYTLPNDTLAGNPENTDYPRTWFSFAMGGKKVTYERKLMYKYVDPAKGEIYAPVVVAPPVTTNILSKDYIFSSAQPQTVQVKLQSFTKASGSISLKAPSGWKISPESIDFTNKAKGAEWVETFTITPTGSNPRTDILKAVVTTHGKEWSMGIQRINYDHIPAITLFPPAEAKLINIDLKTAGKKIGYLAGAGDLVPEALTQVGYEVHQLTENDIMNTDLSIYDAIVVGVRAYNINPRLVVEQPKLLQYINNGGNMVVQYNVYAPLVLNQVGPYPFKITNDRVTDENAKVTFLEPQNPVLNYPNKITDADFDGWIQERGLYFTSSVDNHYSKILSMGDPGEGQNPGSLIVADYGKGRFVYTSLDFFRELPAGVPGAYRLFVNLLSKPQ
ncbi:PIG-L family deacetylase [Mucilaginibacter sp. dw_454]|uniref:PIG-L family deacetylase n=1 Tax=Mucilaginibacter sp. dw_454 TaxID=2720079 RepID=UPI001BD659FF|nr:PIG-L family deacetylase [Mucilaginibacter sp. dw_454]